MKISSIFFLSSIFSLITVNSAYRILAVFPLNVKSHNIILESVAKTLAKNGHQVDVITHFPQKRPFKNFNDLIVLNGSTQGLLNNITLDWITKFHITKYPPLNFIVKAVAENIGNKVCELLRLEEFQELVKNPPQDPPYDLVITEANAAHCYIGLGYVFKVPVIAVVTSVEYPWVSYFIGNVDNPAYVQIRYFSIEGRKMNFWERLYNFYANFVTVYYFHQYTDSNQTESMRNYLRSDIPNIRDVEKSVALTMVNTHPILSGVKPITPGLVQIAGLHIEVNEETLPEDLKKWMDESLRGVVYFTFGSIVPIETFSTKKLEELYASFEKISPIRVLIRIVDNTKLPTGLPKNVKTLPWVPQQPVLAHPNTRAFITHGGLASLEEALYYGIPMIAVPLFSDQFRNVEALISKGMMIRIHFNEFSKKTLDSALSAILENPDYKKNAAHYSKLFRDRPMSATNSTIYWIEYVIRNGGDVLRSPALEFSWWQLHLLDVYGFVLLILISIILMTLLSINFIMNLLTKKFWSRNLVKKKKN